MMSLRGLGNLGGGSGAAKLAATYYQEHSADYYVEDLDHQGQWMGQGAESLGLEGAVVREEFQLSLAGYVAGHEVKNAGQENRQMGWDLTFSAPKSVSIVWAGADAQHKQEIEQAHQRAVECAFGYLEANAFTRRGAGGAIHEDAKLVASRFNHYTSREGDPQVHSHVVVSNFSVREDGTVGTIDSRTFYENKMAAGALYQVELAWQMQKLSYEIEHGIKGTFRLSDVSKEAEQLFSKRDKQIDDLAHERGIKTYAGTRGIVLATRANKVNCDLSEREDTWGREARENSIHLNVEHNRLNQSQIKSDDQILTEASQKLTCGHSTFKENSLLRETALASFGARSGEEVLELTKEAQGRGHIVSLKNGLLTTPEMANIELGIMTKADHMVSQKDFFVDSNRAIKDSFDPSKAKFPFSEEQQIAINTATDSSALAVIQGRAGVGKSTMLTAVRESYEREGFKVQGIALAGVAAQNLQKESGIESKTIASWLSSAELDNKTVVIIDEAGMVGSKQMADVMQKVEEAKAKLILVGDDRQLQPIAAGGILHAIDKHLARNAPEYSTVIEDVKRQREEWMRDVVKSAAQGRTGEALEALDQKNKINIYQNATEARTALVDEYIKENKNDFSKGIILTNIKHDADKINLEIREKLKEMGVVDSMNPVICDNGTKEIGLAKGDRIMLTRNDYKLDVRNGQRATVESADPFGLVDVRLDGGEYRRINVAAYKHIEYGWASTTHKAQGMTVERASVYGFASESMASQQSTYVQISRAKVETKLHIVAGERGVEREGMSVKMEPQQRTEALQQMKKSWSYDAAKDTTLEYTVIKQEQAIKNDLKQERDYGLSL